MTQNLNLFGEEELKQITILQIEEEVILPLIPLVKKRPSKNDSPLEKEIRRFNKLIKELHDYEESNKQKLADKADYDKLYHIKVLPHILELAKDQVLFIKYIEKFFYAEKPNKSLEKRFAEFVLAILNQASQYNDDAKEISRIYLNKQIELLTKAEKKQLSKVMKRDGVNTSDDTFNDFDVNDFIESQTENFDFESFAKEMHESRAEEASAKKDTPISIAELYKELVKILHPDLEQDAKIKHTKEQLMKELTVAKEEHDLHAMLILKQKAHQLNSTAPSDAGYSLEKLKAYNKILKQKLDGFRFNHKNEMLSSLFLSNGFINMSDNTVPNEKKIEAEIADIKSMRKGMAADMKIIKSKAHVVGLMAQSEEDMEEDFDDDFFDEIFFK